MKITSYYQNEINQIIKLFDENKNIIEKRFLSAKDNRICYFTNGMVKMSMKAYQFNQSFKFIKTIGVFLFRENARQGILDR